MMAGSRETDGWVAKPGGSHPFAKCAKGWGTRRNLGRPPAHRDKTAMNGAQLLIAHGDSSGLMSGPPAVKDNDVEILHIYHDAQHRL
jgi:hypothetical protein